MFNHCSAHLVVRSILIRSIWKKNVSTLNRGLYFKHLVKCYNKTETLPYYKVFKDCT